VTLGEIDRPFLAAHELMQPFGAGNAQPLFLTRRVTVRGRREFSIVTQGRTVCAEEIENAIAEHPGISDVAVSPQDDSFAILFVAREGAATLDADIRAFLQKRLPPFARPRKVISVDELPRNASGKLDRRIIASWLR